MGRYLTGFVSSGIHRRPKNLAAKQLEKMSFGEKAKEYVGYFVDELTKPSPEMVEAFTCGDPNKMREKIRESVDKTTLNTVSGLLDLLTPFDVSAANEQLHGEISSGDNAVRQATAVGETAAIGYGLSKLTKSKIVVKFYQKFRSVKNGVISRVADKVKTAELFGLSRAKKAGTTASVSEASATKAPTRLDVIPETEMVQKAAAMPGEWKGQFKVLKEGSEALTGTEFSPNVYSKQVLFKDPKTGQMFRVFQRNDIDPNYVIKEGRYIGRTNLDAMRDGKTPYTMSGEKINLHHVGQDARGPIIEAAEKSHRVHPHKLFGKNKPHPTNPVDRKDFNKVRESYWRAYAEQFK